MVSSGPRRFGLNDSFGIMRSPSAFGPLVLDRLSSRPHSFWSFARRATRRWRGPVGRLYRTSDGVEIDVYGSGRWGLVDPWEVRAFNGWNVLGYSATFTNAAWAKSRSAVSGTDLFNGPSELPGSRASRFYATLQVSNLTHRIHNQSPVSISLKEATDYTLTAWVKRDNCDYINLKITNTAEAATSGNSTFNLSSGTVQSGSGTITALEDGWFRLSLTVEMQTTDTGLVGFVQIYNPTNGASAWLGDDTSGVYIAGTQLERASAYSTPDIRSGVGAGNCLWQKLYDQTGAGRHFEQASNLIMPYACRQGVPVTENGIQSAEFVATDIRRMTVPSSQAYFNFLHTTGGALHAVSRANDTLAAKFILANKNADGAAGTWLYRLANETPVVITGRLTGPTDGRSISVVGGTASTSNSHIVADLDPDNATPASRISWQVNGANPGAANSSSGTPLVEDAAGVLTIGSAPTGGSAWDGTITELGIWNSLIGSGDRGLLWSDASSLWWL